jgi:hypothetical protein
MNGSQQFDEPRCLANILLQIFMREIRVDGTIKDDDLRCKPRAACLSGIPLPIICITGACVARAVPTNLVWTQWRIHDIRLDQIRPPGAPRP